MKKLFFAAIALVAFSGVSMANTIEIEELKEEQVVSTNCIWYALAAAIAEGNNGASPEEFGGNISFYFGLCACADATGSVPLMPVFVR
jgi:hypothetical protein